MGVATRVVAWQFLFVALTVQWSIGQTRPSQQQPSPSIPPALIPLPKVVVVPQPPKGNPKDVPPEILRQYPKGVNVTAPTPATTIPGTGVQILRTRVERANEARNRIERQGHNDDLLVELGLNGGHTPWMYWWEANRWVYLKPPANRGGKASPSNPPAAPVIYAALLKATQSKSPDVRAQAAKALGLIGEADSFTRLRAMLKDPDDIVKLHAWAGIGLLNSTESKLFLSKPPGNSLVLDSAGWALAIGLSEDPPYEVWNKIVEQAVSYRTPMSRGTALWALRMHQPPVAHDLFRELTYYSDGTDLAAVLGLGEFKREEDIELLTDMARKDLRGRVGAVPPMATLKQRPPEFGKNRHAREYEVAGAILALTEYGSKLPFLSRDAFMREEGWKRDGFTEIRGASVPVRNINESTAGDEYRLIAMGVLASSDHVELLNRRLEPPDPGGTALAPQNVVAQQRENTRGFAAVGLGLYLRANGGKEDDVGAPAPGTSRPIPSAADMLVTHYKQDSELTDVRAVCALALGLSGNPVFSRSIKEAMDAFHDGDEPTAGFAALALSMLGDPAGAALAMKSLGPAAVNVDVAALIEDRKDTRPANLPIREIVWRRAMIDALAVRGDQAAVPTLVGEWGKNWITSTEAARAIAWCRFIKDAREDQDATESRRNQPLEDPRVAAFAASLAQILTSDRSPQLSVEAAASLGILYDRRNGLERLARLINGMPFNADFRPADSFSRPASPRAVTSHQLHALANPFYVVFVDYKAAMLEIEPPAGNRLPQGLAAPKPPVYPKYLPGTR